MKQLYQIALWFLMVAVLPVTSVAQNNGVIIDTTVCGSFEWHGSTYTVSDTLVFNSEDSTMVDTTINLTVNHPDSVEFTKTACEEYAWNGVTYNTSGNYTQTFTNIHGCDSVVTLHLTVNHPDHSSTTIDTCESYTWTDGNGQTYTNSGDYTYSHEDANGCAQVDTLHLIINQPTYGDTTAVACGSFRWHGYSNLTESGEYTDTLTNAVGCDSVVTLHLTVHHGTHNTDSASACGRYIWHGTTYTASGTHWYEYTNDDGCPSVDTLHLIINNPTHNSVSDTACETYTWTDGTGETYTSSGTYLHPHEDDNGCWQVDTLHLTINHATYGDTTVVACETFTWHGITYTETPAIAPTDTIVDGNHNGCDSIVTLHLIITHPQHHSDSVISCESYFWRGSVYTLSKDYFDTIFDANGCTQIDTLHLTIHNPVHKSIFVDTCDSYTWTEGTGATYMVSDDYLYIHVDSNGCTQVDTLHLTINHPVTAHFDTAICSSSLPLTWHDTTFEVGTVSGDYILHCKTVRNCDSVVTMTLTVNPIYEVTDTKTVCASQLPYEWNGVTFAAAGTKTTTLNTVNGCDSVVTMTLTVNPIYEVTDTKTICASQLPYEWNGVTFTAAGTKTTTLNTVKGCDSMVTMTLTVNPTYNVTDTKTICASQLPYMWNGVTFAAAGTKTTTLNTVKGCDSVVTMTLTVNPIYEVTDTKTVCASQLPYEWNGVTFAAAGTKNVTLQSVNYCDSIVAMTLTVNPTYNTPITESICQGQSYNFYGQNLTTAGVYTHTLTTSKGCDSIITLTLTVNPLPTVIISGEGSFCLGDNVTLTAMGASSYTWNNASTNPSITVGNAGTYTVTGTDANGCANTASKPVAVNPIYNITVHDTICDGESYNFFGNNLTKDSVYTHTLFTSQGCDSVITLTLTVNYPQHNADTVTECESFTWTNGTGATYNSSGTYMYTHIDVNGCIQVDTLHLTILYGTHNVETVTACESYTWHGMTYTTSGSYTYSYTNSSDCPSVDTLKLTVNYGTHNVETVTACESYTWNDTTYTVSGTYTYSYENALGCPSVDTLHLTVNYGTHNVTDTAVCESFTWYGTTYTVSGTYTHPYTNASGCASVDTLKLTVNYGTHNVETVTACDVYAWKGMIYTISGSYTYSYTNALGCPSVDTLHLTIYPSFILQLSETICQSELPYHYLNGEIDTTFETGTPQSSEVDFVLSTVNGCDSVISLSLTVVPSSLQQLPVVAKCHADGTPYMLVYPQSGLLYQWYRDSVAIAGATGQYFVPEEDLQISTYCYRVHVRPDILHCGVMTDCWEKTEASNAKVRILPNPNSGHFRLLLPEGTANVQILDANGLTVMARTTDGATELEMDTGLANGLYFVKTFRKNGSSNVEKLIINR